MEASGEGLTLFANRFAKTNSLSDESSVIPGSLGLLPSASLAGAPEPGAIVMGLYEP
jgi:3-isopropylmalate dehydrogenase